MTKAVAPLALGGIATIASGAAGNATAAASTIPWSQIAQAADAYVAKESPPGVWPFEAAARPLGSTANKLVFAHYFSFFVLSFDDQPLNQDVWSAYLSPEGEGGKHFAEGGFTRERPLTPAPSSSPYWQEMNAAIEVYRAKAAGLDGFGVDVITLEQPGVTTQARRICDAANAVSPDFHIMLEPDSVILASATPAQIAATLVSLSSCPAVYRLSDGRVVVTPFATNTKPTSYWTEVEAIAAQSGVRIALVSDMLGFADVPSLAPISYGLTEWGQRDPVTAVSAPEVDTETWAQQSTPVWMQPIAAQDVRPTDLAFHEAENTLLFRDMWGRAISSGAPYAHILTWNDYSESTEIGPSSGTQFLFSDLNRYYAEWFRAGQPPRITADAIYYSYRPALLNASDTLFQLQGETPLSNSVEMVAMLTAPAMIAIAVGDHVAYRSVPAGLQTLTMPSVPGQPMFGIFRNGKSVVTLVGHTVVQAQVNPENPMYFGGSSTRAYVSVP